MTDTKDVAYVRERLCMASDVLNEIFVKTKEISEENTQLKELLKSALSWLPDGSKLRGLRYAQLQDLKRKIIEELK